MDQYRRPQPKPAQAAASPTAAPLQKQSSVKKWVIIVIAAIVLLVAAVAVYKFSYKKDNTGLAGVNKDQYQALFLTNGQVYFGKLEQADKSTVKISDIYYLQVQQPVQPKEDEQQQGETQLVKLGEELHGPEDEMFIDRGQILFWENLKDNGKVVSAIKEYKKQ